MEFYIGVGFSVGLKVDEKIHKPVAVLEQSFVNQQRQIRVGYDDLE